MADYKIKESGEIIFPDGRKMPEQKDSLWIEYIKLEYEIENSRHNSTKDPIKIARYNELKKYFDDNEVPGRKNVEETTKALNEAKEKIKQEIIASDKSPDNSVLYAAIANFKKRHE